MAAIRLTQSSTTGNGIRALNLEHTLEDLRTRPTSDEDLLNILAKIEISAVQLQTLTASRVRRFLQHVPETGYHFDFIRRYPAFYFLNHGTFAPVDRGRFPLAVELMSELKKHGEKSPHVKKGDRLSNERVLHTLTEFLNDVNRISEIQKLIQGRCLIDDEPTRPQNRIREFNESDLKHIEKAITTSYPLRNCRAVAELLEELYFMIFEAFRTSFTARSLHRNEDTPLDTVLKCIHCAENHTRSTESETDFQKAIERASDSLSELSTTDIYDMQQPGSEFTKSASFKISSRSLTAKDRPDMRFPILVPSTDLLRHAAPRNIFFYPGAVFGILRAAAREYQEPLRELTAFNDFCSSINEILFVQNPDSRHRTANIRDILERTRTFYFLGLTPTTSATYVRMLTTKWSPFHGIRSELNEAIDHITFLVYNAHIHFLCLTRYSNTFLFHHARRLILEQQRSLLTGNKMLEDVCSNATFNITRTFGIRYDEDEFNMTAANVPPSGREYLYRDAVNKWDDVNFTLDHEDITDTAHIPPPHDPTPEEIARACELADEDISSSSYTSLLPLSTYPQFDRILTQKIVLPSFHMIINLHPYEIRTAEDTRLLRIIHICRLLMPRRLGLYRNLVSLQNLLQYVSRTDLGLVKVLYGVIRSIILYLHDITGESYAMHSEMLEELTVESFIDVIETEVIHSLREANTEREKIADKFRIHCLACYHLLRSRATLYTETNTVLLTSRHNIIVRVPLPVFLHRAQKIITDNAELEEAIRLLSDTDDRILDRLKSLAIDAKSIVTCTNLTFNTRSVSRLHAKIRDAVNTTKTTFTMLCLDRFPFNRETCGVLASLVSAFQTMDSRRLEERGTRQCVADAVALLESHDSSQPAAPGDEFDSDSITILKNIFAADDIPAAVPRQRQMGGLDTDRIDDETEGRDGTVLDYDRERYVPATSLTGLKDWYVEKIETVQNDLTRPLRLSRPLPPPSSPGTTPSSNHNQQNAPAS